MCKNTEYSALRNSFVEGNKLREGKDEDERPLTFLMFRY